MKHFKISTLFFFIALISAQITFAEEIYNSRCIFNTERVLEFDSNDGPNSETYPYIVKFPKGRLCSGAQAALESFLSQNKDKWYYHGGPFSSESSQKYIKLAEYGYDDIYYYDEGYSEVAIDTTNLPLGVNINATAIFFSKFNHVQQYSPNLETGKNLKSVYRVDKEIKSSYPDTSRPAELSSIVSNERKRSWTSHLFPGSENPASVSLSRDSNTIRNAQFAHTIYSKDYLNQDLSDSDVKHYQKIFVDYDFFRIPYQVGQESLMFLYHLRNPGINFDIAIHDRGLIKKEGLSTLYKLAIFIKREDVPKACSYLSHQYEKASGREMPSVEYSDKVKQIFLQQNRSISNMMFEYFSSSEQALEEAISLFDSSNYEVQMSPLPSQDLKFVYESLKGLSILKMNSCLSHIKADQIKNNMSSVRVRVQECKDSGAISQQQFALINAFLDSAKKDEQYLTVEQREAIATISEMGKQSKMDKLTVQNRALKVYQLFSKSDTGAANLCLNFMSEDLKGAIGK